MSEEKKARIRKLNEIVQKWGTADVSESTETAGSILPLDNRRLLSIASDICQSYPCKITSYEREVMTWAIVEFHKFLVKQK